MFVTAHGMSFYDLCCLIKPMRSIDFLWVLWYNSSIKEVCVMLNVWVNLPANTDVLVDNVANVFRDYKKFELITTEIGTRIVKAVSRVVTVNNYADMVNDWGEQLSPLDLSDGAKMLLLMLNEDARNDGLIFDYSFCGDNCDEFLEEIAGMYDINLYLGRFYIPFSNEDSFKYGVRFMESGLVVYDSKSFIHEFYRLDKRADVPVIEDEGWGDAAVSDDFIKNFYGDD